MKRLKFLPSIIMLVLCVGILAVGIYAAAPTNHTVGGSITVTGSKAVVDIEAWVVGSTSDPVKHTNANSTKTLNFSGLEMDLSELTALYEAEPIAIKIKITNKVGWELGAYFLDTETPVADLTSENIPTEATRSDILTDDTLQHNSKDIVNVKLNPYAHIGAANTENNTDEATLTIYFTPAGWVNEDIITPMSFNYALVIEDYKPNVTGETIATPTADETVTEDGEATTRNSFIKFSSIVGEEPRTIINNPGWISLADVAETGMYAIFVIPNGVTSLKANAINGDVGALHLPNSIEQVNLDGWTFTSEYVDFFVSDGNPQYFSDYQGAIISKTVIGEIVYAGVGPTFVIGPNTNISTNGPYQGSNVLFYRNIKTLVLLSSDLTNDFSKTNIECLFTNGILNTIIIKAGSGAVSVPFNSSLGTWQLNGETITSFSRHATEDRVYTKLAS